MILYWNILRFIGNDIFMFLKCLLPKMNQPLTTRDISILTNTNTNTIINTRIYDFVNNSGHCLFEIFCGFFLQQNL